MVDCENWHFVDLECAQGGKVMLHINSDQASVVEFLDKLSRVSIGMFPNMQVYLPATVILPEDLAYKTSFDDHLTC